MSTPLDCGLLDDLSNPDGCNRYGLPGITHLYAANRADVAAIAYDATNPTGCVADLTFAANTRLYQLEVLDESAELVTNLQRENGLYYWAFTLRFRLNLRTCPLLAQLKQLPGSRLLVIARERNGRYKLAGVDDGLRLDQLERSTGAANADDAAANLTWVGADTQGAFYLLGGQPADDEATRLAATQTLIDTWLALPTS